MPPPPPPPIKTLKKRVKKEEVPEMKLIMVLCESLSNILAGNIPINNDIKSKLKKHRASLHFLCEKKHSIKKRKQVLGQKGGAFPLIIPALVTGISSIISSLISR